MVEVRGRVSVVGGDDVARGNESTKQTVRDVEPLADEDLRSRQGFVCDMERPQTRRGNSDTNPYWENSETNEGGGGTESGGTASGTVSRPLTRMVTTCFYLP